jgi:hypothetical protein
MHLYSPCIHLCLKGYKWLEVGRDLCAGEGYVLLENVDHKRKLSGAMRARRRSKAKLKGLSAQRTEKSGPGSG